MIECEAAVSNRLCLPPERFFQIWTCQPDVSYVAVLEATVAESKLSTGSFL
jgi:hypothetical protein